MTSRNPGRSPKADGLAELERRRALALGMGGAERVAAQHGAGRLTARERVALLLDEGSFVELGMLAHSDRPEVGERAPADAAVTGVGTVEGRKVRAVRRHRVPLVSMIGHTVRTLCLSTS